MSIKQYAHQVVEHHHQRKDVRALERAIANAPTPASRHELEMLARR